MLQSIWTFFKKNIYIFIIGILLLIIFLRKPVQNIQYVQDQTKIDSLQKANKLKMDSITTYFENKISKSDSRVDSAFKLIAQNDQHIKKSQDSILKNFPSIRSFNSMQLEKYFTEYTPLYIDSTNKDSSNIKLGN